RSAVRRGDLWIERAGLDPQRLLEVGDDPGRLAAVEHERIRGGALRYAYRPGVHVEPQLARRLWLRGQRDPRLRDAPRGLQDPVEGPPWDSRGRGKRIERVRREP